MEDDSGRETCGDCLEKKTLIYVVIVGTFVLGKPGFMSGEPIFECIET
jgi:hypothetical protein